MITINRLYMENYKLFSSKEIVFAGAMLLIFDGPNGYGKTSIFDAIELLITGKMSRVKECDAINGNLSYDTIFFAKNKDKDVIIKGEFVQCNNDEKIVIGAKIGIDEIKGKQVNPKNIFDSINFYILPQYDISIDEWQSYKCNERINTIREKYFGKQDIDEYTLFHYIRQEDRLAYFKQNEASRSKTIEDLLGVENERKKLNDIKTKHRILKNKCKEIDSEIKKKKTVLEQKPKNSHHDVIYQRILEGDYPWDREQVAFGNEKRDETLQQYYFELEGLKSYVENKQYHNIYDAITDFNKIPKQYQLYVLKAHMMKKQKIDFDELFKSYSALLFLKKQKELIDEKEYYGIKFQQLCLELKIDENIVNKLVTEQQRLTQLSKKQSELQSSVNNLLKIRDSLRSKQESIYVDSSVCPYCGYDWQEHRILEKHFDETRVIINRLLEGEGEQYNIQVKKVEKIIDDEVMSSLKNKIELLKNDNSIRIISNFEDKVQLIAFMSLAEKAFNHVYANVVNDMKDNAQFEEIAEVVLTKISGMIVEIPNAYIEANEKMNFSLINRKYNLSNEKAQNITVEQIEDKKKYINNQYYMSFESLLNEVQELEKVRETLNEIEKQVKGYSDSLSAAMGKYKKQIIDEIEIPFFVYSSRLLQSYQGGQGVLMENDGDAIRFKAPGSEHDILYTMSSGQLSAVLLAFSLAMNKIYAGDGIKTIFIDDPIQCMDDINMISFVELLRREFLDYQIILSTHEEDFSNYIRYKFKKYGLLAKAITLKEA
ncbi:MAG: AAA family ATPase [Lachnospiraceae bacterium]|nr:AAA family ATPase [Lachnospiraceae bacterium]